MRELLFETGATTIPIILLIALGWFIRRRSLISAEGFDQIKTLIVKIALPALLFSSFLTVEFERAYLGIFVFIPILCISLLGLGYLFSRTRFGHPFSPFLMTGFEFGMIGITLFGTAYGMDQIGVLGVVGLSHEFFIWFGFVTILEAKVGGTRSIGDTLRGFLHSPVIIAVILGTAANLLGLGSWFSRAMIPSALLTAMHHLSGMIIPLILINVGYGMRIDIAGIRQALPTVLTRLVLVLSVALLANPWLVRVLGLPAIFGHALFTFVLLPPPFIVPLYIDRKHADDMTYANNVLSVYTLVSIVAFLVYVAFHPV